jgi:hypothetical protein
MLFQWLWILLWCFLIYILRLSGVLDVAIGSCYIVLFIEGYCICRMQRNRGQFTSSKPKPDEIAAASEMAAVDGSPNWALVEGRPPSAAE